MSDPTTQVALCNAEFAAGRASRDADIKNWSACEAAANIPAVLDYVGQLEKERDTLREQLTDNNLFDSDRNQWRNNYRSKIADITDQLSMRDAEIADLKVVSDHNLHIYQEAASKMRVEITDLNNRLAFLGEMASSCVGEKEKLREQVKMLREWTVEAVEFVGNMKWSPSLESQGRRVIAATEPKP